MRAKKFLTQRLIPSDRQRDYEALAASRPVANMDAFLQHCQRRRYPAKSTIIFAGEQGESLYFMISGTVTVVLEDDEGREMILAYLSEGEFFGELGVYDDGQQQRSASVRTRTDCVIGKMDYQRFHELAKIYPSLMKALDSQVASRLRTTTKKVLDLAFLDVTGRVASCLLDLCKLPEAVEVEDGVQLKISRQEIARIVGCYREMAGRILKDMQDMGLIQAQGMTVVLLGATKEYDSEE